MNHEIQQIIHMLKEAYEGGPWHGRSIKALLAEVTHEVGLRKPDANSHSIAELIYHMAIWRDFTVSRLQPDGRPVSYFDENDWQQLDHNDPQTWTKGLQLLDESHQRLIKALEQFQDS